jgi:hypothetical protein
MQDNNFLEYYKNRDDYKLLPEDTIETQIDGKIRVVKIGRPYHYQGIVCCNGRYMDGDKEYFLNVPQDTILSGAVSPNHQPIV